MNSWKRSLCSIYRFRKRFWSCVNGSNLLGVGEERSDGTGSESCDGNVPGSWNSVQIKGK